uniref:GTD-binding domain-containing protein n=1 Tax=Chenopodium quinoa TaxID=63459 RepID=A0A803LZC2_CHEQI
KFLALLGLTLPCPCNGLFGYPTRAPCFQRFLVDCPAETISSLHFSVKSKFPFDSILSRNDHSQLNLKLLREGYSDDGVLHLEGEASYSSFSDPRRSHHTLSGTDSLSKFDIKGKTVTTQRPRCGIRRRRRASIDYGKFTSASSYDHLKSDSRAIRQSPSDSSKIENVENPTTVNSCGQTQPDSESNDAADESKPVYDYATLFENLKNNAGADGEDENVVRILESALEEEHAARAELFSELEQERLAAASAADEAMAMISRLQEEKASIEIEARQYQRILEEKSVYDAEEMDILKEIIVRREREKHFLEKEVEVYRKVFQVNNGWDSQSNDTERQNDASALDPSVDPMLILQQLGQSIDNRENVESINNYPDYSSVYGQKKTSTVSECKESSALPVDKNELKSLECSSVVPDLIDDETNQDIQEKGMLSMDTIPRSLEGNSNIYLQQKTMFGVDDGKQMPLQVVEPRVHDVHIIDSKHSISKTTDGKEGGPLLIHNNFSDTVRQCDLEIRRSSSDIFDRFPTVCSSPDRSFVSESRCYSISAVDHERLKIDDEICWLRARLRTVQEEKEKLKGSFEHQERAKTELKLLEDIAVQLREIRHLTAPEKAARQASLPPLSSKVCSR